MKLNKLFATLLMFVLLITSIPDTNIMAASKVPAPTIQTIKQSSGACVTVKWKKVKNAKGYLVYRRTGSKGKYKQIKKISKNTTLSYVDKTTKDGTTYYYKIRAYIGATKSPNSGAKKIKTSGTPKLGELVSDSTGIFENTDAKVTCSIKVKNFIRVKKILLRYILEILWLDICMMMERMEIFKRMMVFSPMKPLLITRQMRYLYLLANIRPIKVTL